MIESEEPHDYVRAVLLMGGGGHEYKMGHGGFVTVAQNRKKNRFFSQVCDLVNGFFLAVKR